MWRHKKRKKKCFLCFDHRHLFPPAYFRVENKSRQTFPHPLIAHCWSIIVWQSEKLSNKHGHNSHLRTCGGWMPIKISYRLGGNAENAEFNFIGRLVVNVGQWRDIRVSLWACLWVGKTHGIEIVFWVSSDGKFECWTAKSNGKMRNWKKEEETLLSAAAISWP